MEPRSVRGRGLRGSVVAGLALTALVSGVAQAAPINFKVTVENLAPNGGTLITPLWFGVHDGGFDLYDSGVAASAELERLAEDGNPGPLSGAFASTAGGFIDGVVFGPGVGPGSPPIFGPGGSASATFSYDFGASTSAYFSYASMVIPSNDAFIANGNPLALPLFDAGGGFQGIDIIVLGSQVLDAGTEVNDEIPTNVAALAQAAPDTGVTEGGVVGLHPGFLTGGNILAAIPNGDFTQAGYQVARIRVEQVPLPGTWWLFGAGLAAIGARRFTG